MSVTPNNITRPSTRSVQHGPLAALSRRPHWVGHRKKRPVNPITGWDASPTDPATWGSHATALAMVTRQQADGVGYVLTADAPEMCIDLDHCIDAHGTVEPWAMEIVEALNSYTEVSPSGTGLHIWVRASVPGNRKRSGKIEMYDRDRYMTVTGRPLPGYNRPIRDAQAQVGALYARVFTQTEHAASTAPVTLTLDDHEIVDRLQRERDGKAARLLDGDTGSSPSPSEARAALAWKCCFYSDDVDQVERIVRTSGLFKAADNDRERDRKARNDAAHAVATYAGPRYTPDHTREPYLTLLTAPETADAQELAGDADLRAQLAVAHAFILRQGETIGILRDRLRREEARVEVYKNTDLGSARNVGAVLGDVLQEMTPREPDGETPYRLPLDRLADRTNQSPETCSRQLKALATYKGPDGEPFVTVDTRKIPRRVDTATGEILGPTKEMWVGTTCEPAELTRMLGTLAPDNAPQHGGATDRGVCPDCPDAGVIRRERTSTRITHECAHCKKLLDVETITGPSTRTHLDCIGGEPILHDADQGDEWFPEPFAHRPHEDAFPILHDADQEPPANLNPPSILQHARTTDNHTSLSCKMKDRGTPHVSDREPPPAYVSHALPIDTGPDAASRAAYWRGEASS